MRNYDLAGNLTKADHLHNSAHDEECEYDDAYRLTKYIKDPDGSPTNQQWELDGVYMLRAKCVPRAHTAYR